MEKGEKGRPEGWTIERVAIKKQAAEEEAFTERPFSRRASAAQLRRSAGRPRPDRPVRARRCLAEPGGWSTRWILVGRAEYKSERRSDLKPSVAHGGFRRTPPLSGPLLSAHQPRRSLLLKVGSSNRTVLNHRGRYLSLAVFDPIPKPFRLTPNPRPADPESASGARI